MCRFGTLSSAALMGTALCMAALAEARITRIEIQHTQSPPFGGETFKVGAYERLSGRAYLGF